MREMREGHITLEYDITRLLPVMHPDAGGYEATVEFRIFEDGRLIDDSAEDLSYHFGTWGNDSHGGIRFVTNAEDLKSVEVIDERLHQILLGAADELYGRAVNLWGEILPQVLDDNAGGEQ